MSQSFRCREALACCKITYRTVVMSVIGKTSAQKTRFAVQSAVKRSRSDDAYVRHWTSGRVGLAGGQSVIRPSDEDQGSIDQPIHSDNAYVRARRSHRLLRRMYTRIPVNNRLRAPRFSSVHYTFFPLLLSTRRAAAVNGLGNRPNKGHTTAAPSAQLSDFLIASLQRLSHGRLSTASQSQYVAPHILLTASSSVCCCTALVM